MCDLVYPEFHRISFFLAPPIIPKNLQRSSMMDTSKSTSSHNNAAAATGGGGPTGGGGGGGGGGGDGSAVTFGATTERLLQLSAILGFTGVGLGAMGAHALRNKLLERGVLETWQTAILYQLFHATAVLGVAALHSQQQQQHKQSSMVPSSSYTQAKTQSTNTMALRRLELVGWALGMGSILFSGSIYLLCLEIGPKKLWGPTTPLGGFVMLGGWGLLGFCSLNPINKNDNNKNKNNSPPNNKTS